MKSKLILLLISVAVIFSAGCSNQDENHSSEEPLESYSSLQNGSSSEVSSLPSSSVPASSIASSKESSSSGISESDYKSQCVEFPPYNDYLRDSKSYSKEKFVLELTITKIAKDDEIKSLNYFVGEDNDGNEYFVWDERSIMTPELFENDVIKLYCNPSPNKSESIVEPGIIPVRSTAPELFGIYVELIN